MAQPEERMPQLELIENVPPRDNSTQEPEKGIAEAPAEKEVKKRKAMVIVLVLVLCKLILSLLLSYCVSYTM
jgi:hypothetical protein